MPRSFPSIPIGSTYTDSQFLWFVLFSFLQLFDFRYQDCVGEGAASPTPLAPTPPVPEAPSPAVQTTPEPPTLVVQTTPQAILQSMNLMVSISIGNIPDMSTMVVRPMIPRIIRCCYRRYGWRWMRWGIRMGGIMD